MASLCFLLLAFLTAVNGLRICHHNDFHARYAEINRFNAPCSAEDSLNGRCFSSFARLQTAFRMMSCDMRVSAGDFVQGSVYDSLLGSEITRAVYGDLQYNILTFGNHEFNKGVLPIYDVISNLPNKSIWLSSNTYLNSRPDNVTINSSLERHGMCFVSALTPQTLRISNPGPTVWIDDPAVALNRAKLECSNATRRNLIAVTHVGYEQDKQLCLDVPGVDLIIGGHSHTDLVDGGYPTKVVRPDGSVCWVVQAFAYGRYMGVLDVNFDDEGKLFFSGHSYLPLDARVVPDLRSQNLLATFTARLSTSLKQVVGVATVPIDGSRDCRARECEMGNLITDALLSYGKLKEGAEIAIQNGGGVRSGIDGGEITREEILSVLPFGNIHNTLSIPGSTLRAVLENGMLGAGNGEINGRFPQVSGITFEASFSATPGKRVKKITFGEKREPIVDTQFYRVITNGFITGGGDGYEWTGAKDIQRSGRSLDVLLSEYLAANNPYTPKVEGRIVNTDAA